MSAISKKLENRAQQLEVSAKALIDAALQANNGQPSLASVKHIAQYVLGFIKESLLEFCPSSEVYEIMDKADVILDDLTVLLNEQ